MNWGILATGTIAEKFASTLEAMAAEGERLTAVGSRRIDAARAFAEKHAVPAYYGSYEELLADPAVEAVYIATPNHLHYENTKAALLAGRHVLCEKPFTTDAAQARELYALAEERGLVLLEALWTEYLPLYARLREIIASGVYGPVRYARCVYGFAAQGARRRRKLLSELGGGALLDVGIYNLAFLRLVMGGGPESFASQVRMSEYGTDEMSVLQLSYPGGGLAQCLQSTALVMERRASVVLEGAEIQLPDFQFAFSMTVLPREGEAFTLEFPPDVNGFEYEIRAMTGCVREGRRRCEAYPPEESLALLSQLDDIRRSWGMKFSFES